MCSPWPAVISTSWTSDGIGKADIDGDNDYKIKGHYYRDVETGGFPSISGPLYRLALSPMHWANSCNLVAEGIGGNICMVERNDDI